MSDAAPGAPPTSAALDERITQAKLRVRLRSPFFGTLALFATYELDEQVSGAATDGRRIYLEPAYVARASPSELEVQLLHQLLHAALLHPQRMRGREPELWNAAADIVVNGILVAAGLTLPAGAVRDDAIADWRVEDVYDLLMRERALRKLPKAPPDLRPSDADDASPRAAKEAETRWAAAIVEAEAAVSRSRGGGAVPVAMARFFRGVHVPRLDWRAQLWRFLARTPTDFEDFDRRFVGQGLYLETLAGQALRVLACVDTSASVGAGELSLFLGELVELVRVYPHLDVSLYFADQRLHGPFALRRDAPIPPPVGGGGTTFVPFFERVAREDDLARPAVCVYLTDGEGTFPTAGPRMPTLWVVTPRGARESAFPFGEVVHLTDVPTAAPR